MSRDLHKTSVCLFCGKPAVSTERVLRSSSVVETFKWKRSSVQVLSETICSADTVLIVKDILGRAAFCNRCDLKMKDLCWAIQTVKTMGSRIADSLREMIGKVKSHNENLKYQPFSPRHNKIRKCIYDATADILDCTEQPFLSNTSTHDIRSAFLRKLAKGSKVKTNVWGSCTGIKTAGRLVRTKKVPNTCKFSDQNGRSLKLKDSGKKTLPGGQRCTVPKIDGNVLRKRKHVSVRKVQFKPTELQPRRSWNCGLTGCGVRCLSAVGLNDHFQRIHLGNKKPSKCHLCEKTFPNLYKLNLHKNSVHNARKYVSGSKNLGY